MTKLCLALNRTILQAQGSIRSCPAFAACYNESLGTVCYFNAGHTPGLLRDRTGITALPASGLPLGLFSHATCEAPMVALEPGASLLLVSRGVLEGKYKDEEFGLDRLKDIFLNGSSDDARELSLGIITGVEQFMRTPPTHNDVTIHLSSACGVGGIDDVKRKFSNLGDVAAKRQRTHARQLHRNGDHDGGHVPHLANTLRNIFFTVASLVLAGFVLRYVGEFVASAGQVGEARLLLLAALVIADELSDANDALEQERNRDGRAEFASKGVRGMAGQGEPIAPHLPTP